METELIYYSDEMRHLICEPYTVENLHKMANDLDIKKCWFHNKHGMPHYDIPKRRIKEIAEKTTVITSRDLYLKISRAKNNI